MADSKARLLAKLLDSSGDVVSSGLDNVPASDDASALTTGTLPAARIASGAITNVKLGTDISASKITTGTLPAARYTQGATNLNELTDTTVSASDPTVSTNPSAVGHLWINSTSGEQFIATTITAGANVWTNTGEGTGNIVPLYNIEYLVIAGGGGGGDTLGGGGGAGGYKTATGFTITPGTSYTVTVGAGGPEVNDARGANGENSVFGTIISTGGGGGGRTPTAGSNGGSGGGAYWTSTVGLGTSGQGNNGGSGASNENSGGGGGSDSVGGNATTATGGDGGTGLSSSITGSSIARAGGGGGGSFNSGYGGGRAGGGDAGPRGGQSGHATANSGSGGGGAAYSPVGNAGNGGSGVVILKILTSDYSDTTTGSPNVATSGSYKVLTFNGDGTYTG